jgi:hypothetical protein
MKKILLIILFSILILNSCVNLSLDSGEYGTSVGIGLKSGDGAVRLRQNIDFRHK